MLAGDAEAAVATMSDDVTFNSPIVFKPSTGKAAAQVVLGAVIQVLEDARYEAELSSADGRDHALVFKARIGDREIEGCDFLHHGDDGSVDRLTVMVRPLSAALALRDRMAALLAAAGGGHEAA
jgi:SnoaL-like domain